MEVTPPADPRFRMRLSALAGAARSRPFACSILILTLTLSLFAHIAPKTIAHPSSDPISVEQNADTADPISVEQVPDASSEPLSVEQIADTLSARIQDVRDVSATVSFVQVSERDGSRMEGEVRLAAIFPDLVRATWNKPDYLSGVIWILDSENNMFTQYIPVSGEAARLPLDETLEDQSALPFATPEDLFTLPPQDRFDLTIVDEANPDLVTVQAKSKGGDQTYLLLVDTSKWLVTQFQTLNAKGAVNFSAIARDIQINQSLQAAELRRLPPGVIERSFP